MDKELKYRVKIDADTTDSKKLEKSLKDVDKAAGKAQKSTKKYNAETKKTSAVSKKAAGANEKTAGSLKSIGGTAGAVAAVGVSVMALAKAGLYASMQFSEFDDKMRKVAAVSGATSAEFGKMTALAEKMGQNTRYTSTQAAEGMEFLALAGFNAKASIAALPNVLNLAAAGATELGAASDITTNILTGYGLKVKDLSDVNDVLVKTFTSSNTSLQDLGYAFSYVGPVAKASGAAFNETAAILGKLADAGYRGEKGGTVLRGAYARLQKGMRPVVETLQKLNVESHDSTGKMRSMTDIIRDLAAKGITAKQSLKLFGVVAGPGMMALIDQGADSIDALREKINIAGGTSARVAGQMEAGLGGAMRSLASAWDGLVKKFGGGTQEMTPGMKYLTDALKDPAVVQSLKDWGAAWGSIASWVQRTAGYLLKYIGWLYQLTQAFGEPIEKTKKLAKLTGEAAEKAKKLSATLADAGGEAQKTAENAHKIGNALTEGGNVNLDQPIKALGATSKAVAKFAKDAQAAYQKASEEAEKYAQKAIEWAQKIKDANLTTEQKIAELKRQGLTEVEKKASREQEIAQTLAAMKEASAQKDFETADRLAKHAETLYLANIGGQEKVSAAQISGYESIRQAYNDSVLEPQKRGAEEQAEAAKTSAEKIKGVLDSIESKEVGVDFSVADLQKMQKQIAELTKDETKTIYTKMVEQKASGGRVGMAAGGRFLGNSTIDSIPVMARPGEGFTRNEALSVWDKAIGTGFFEGVNNPWGANGRRIMQAMIGNTPKIGVAMPSAPKTAFATGGRVGKAEKLGSFEIKIGGKSHTGLFEPDVAKSLTKQLKGLQKRRPNSF